MSDLSDPTALPDEVREAARDALSGGYFDGVFENDDEAYDAISAVAPILAAHFAAELDGLRAQIEEAWALRNKPGAHKEHVLAVFAQSPRGTVARIQSDALEAFADKIGKTAFARDEVVGLLCDEADALREGAGQ